MPLKANKNMIERIKLNYNNYNIHVVDHYKYLGVEIDNKGNIRKYVQRIKNKVIDKEKIVKNLQMSQRIILFPYYAEPHFQYIKA